MTRSVACLLLLSALAGCSRVADVVRGLDPAPVQPAVDIHRMPLDGSLRREDAAPLAAARVVDLQRDDTDTGAAHLLGDGTLYRLELDRLGNRGAVLIRFDDLAGAATPTTIPLVAPPGQTIRAEPPLGLRVATGTAGVQMDRNRRGTAWWEEDGVDGRLIEFRIDGDRAVMLPPSGSLDDPGTAVARRFNRTPARELPYRFTTDPPDVVRDTPRAYLGGSGFSLGLTRIGGERTEALVESPAFDLPHVDVAADPKGWLRVTIGYITSSSGHATQVTYDPGARAWKEHRPLVNFPEAQGVEVGDVGPAGVLVGLILPWNGAVHDPETGLYWIREGRPVRHLLQRTRKLKTVTVPDGFVALFEDEFKDGEKYDDPKDMFVLRARGEELALHKFRRPGLSGVDHFTWLGGNRFAAMFGNNQVVVFDVP
ncbi:MAG TPA: hypothetical protein VFZ31_04085 [Vicinamibacterales bacterium]